MSFSIVPEFYGEESSQMYMIQSLHEINQGLQAHLEKANRAYNVQPGQSNEESEKFQRERIMCQYQTPANCLKELEIDFLDLFHNFSPD